MPKSRAGTRTANDHFDAASDVTGQYSRSAPDTGTGDSCCAICASRADVFNASTKAGLRRCC